MTGGQKVGSSNLLIPTIFLPFLEAKAGKLRRNNDSFKFPLKTLNSYCFKHDKPPQYTTSNYRAVFIRLAIS